MDRAQSREWCVKAFGALLLALGGSAALLAPAEMYCFYLFSEGGRFAYDGFGFGSFMFGIIAAQIAGYYLIAAALIPLGYGHLRLRPWSRVLGEGLVRVWIVAGLPLIAASLFVFAGTKAPSTSSAVAALVAATVSYVLLPFIALSFYRGSRTASVFSRTRGTHASCDGLAPRLVAICLLDVVYITAFHLLILFNGVFPVFVGWLSGLPGILVLDVLILALGILLWGTWQRRLWAWRGQLVYFGIMAVLWIGALARTRWDELLRLLSFPVYEVKILENMPLHGGHLAVLVGVPLILTLTTLIQARACFGDRIGRS